LSRWAARIAPRASGAQIAAAYLLADQDTAAGGDWFDAVARPEDLETDFTGIIETATSRATDRVGLRTYAELMTMFDNPKFPDQLSALGGDPATAADFVYNTAVSLAVGVGALGLRTRARAVGDRVTGQLLAIAILTGAGLAAFAERGEPLRPELPIRDVLYAHCADIGRDPREITHGMGKQTAPEGVKVYNPAFDVTPAALVWALVTENGVRA